MVKPNLSQSVTPSSVEVPHIAMSTKELAKAKLQEFIKEETKLVKGIFKCFETPGSIQKIIVRKYPGIPIFEKEMVDGMTYEIPLYVARHLNGVDVTAGALGDSRTRNSMIGTCSFPIHGFKWRNGEAAPSSALGDSGVPVPIVGIQKRFQRFGFQSMEFGASNE